jgi:hypothetical protein
MEYWKQGDVFIWSWNDKMLKKLKDGNNGGTTYWCKSCFGIVQEDGKLHDTYWSGTSDTRWDAERAAEELELVYLGNLNDYRKAEPYERACYKDADCLDLNHANSSRGNFYIRKDAVQCNDKKRKIIERSRKKLESEIRYQLKQIERYKHLLDSREYENMQSLCYENDVGIYDDHYLDYE